VARILVVDDDPHLREVVRFALERAGYAVTEAADGAAALAAFAAEPADLIVLDVTMPELDGLEVCRRLRSGGAVPIVFLSSRDGELDRVLGLELGADDYVTKPFSPRELVARVKARLRTHASPPLADVTERFVVRHGPLTLDAERHRCAWGDSEVALSATEFLLLHALLGSPERVYTRADLVARAYGQGHAITERTVDSHVRRIRAKFEPLGVDPIDTVYGVGYRMRRLETGA
jgi:two-component system OmpR family response regulator